MSKNFTPAELRRLLEEAAAGRIGVEELVATTVVATEGMSGEERIQLLRDTQAEFQSGDEEDEDGE